jgi:hypothetical protein
MRKIDLTGQRFGSLTVVREEGKQATNVTWLCRCDCGGQAVVQGSRLHTGTIAACIDCRQFGRRKRVEREPVAEPAAAFIDLRPGLARCSCGKVFRPDPGQTRCNPCAPQRGVMGRSFTGSAAAMAAS